MAVFPTGSSATGTPSPVLSLSTIGDQINYPIAVASIRWHLTTAASSTWALHVTQSSACAASTVGWPIVGTTGPMYLGMSTAYGIPPIIDLPVNNWCFGVVLSTIGGGFIEVIKGAPGLDWVRLRPNMPTTAIQA